MPAKLQTVRWLTLNELRLVLRDRRTLFMSVLLPLLVWPLMLLASRSAEEQRRETLERMHFSYTVVGPQADRARQLIESARRELSSEGEGDSDFEEIRVDDPAQSLDAGEIHFFVRADLGTEEGEQGEEEENGRVANEAGEPAFSDIPVLEIVFRADRDTSRTGAQRLENGLREERHDRRARLLADRGFPIEPDRLAELESEDVATRSQASGTLLGRFLTALVMMFLLSGAAIVATDSLAGEKERGTLETLLTSAASRLDIVLAKQAAVLVVAIAITAIQVINLLVYVGFELIPLPDSFELTISLPGALLVGLLYLPLASIVASVLLLVSGHAKSYKEAQLFFFPIFLLGLVPTLVPVLPGLELRSPILLVPIANLSVAVKEILGGVFDWPMIGVAWLLNAGVAAWVARITTRALSTERLVTATETGDLERLEGPALFERRVLPWFAVSWAVFLLVGLNLPSEAGLASQILVNMTLFVVASLLMLRLYRLPLKQALAIRPVDPRVWPAVALGAPATGLLIGGLVELVGRWMPIPEEMIEEFSRLFSAPGLELWQLLLLAALLPAVCEEIAFRGVLLYGLRRRLRPVSAVLVNGVIFGLFHVALFRILPTALLGALLAALTLVTGSIFPAMLWHALHNASGVLLAQSGSGEIAPPWLYGVAALVALFSFWLLWKVGRSRTSTQVGPVLETERLVLRPLTMAESDEVYRLWTDPLVRRYLFDDQVIPPSRVEEEIELSQAHFRGHGVGLWSIRQKGDRELAGFCGYRHFHDPPELQLLYGLAPRFWNRGLATEAAREVIRYGFEECGFARVVASTDAPNEASQEVMKRLGMTFSKRRLVDGLDTIYYELRREDFVPRRNDHAP